MNCEPSFSIIYQTEILPGLVNGHNICDRDTYYHGFIFKYTITCTRDAQLVFASQKWLGKASAIKTKTSQHLSLDMLLNILNLPMKPAGKVGSVRTLPSILISLCFTILLTSSPVKAYLSLFLNRTTSGRHSLSL